MSKQMINKQKEWRRDAEKHNRDESLAQGERVRHQGRKYKSKVGSAWMNATSRLFTALMNRGSYNTAKIGAQP